MEPDHGLARRTGPVEAGRGSSDLSRHYRDTKHRAELWIQTVPNLHRTACSPNVGSLAARSYVTVPPRCHSPVAAATIPQSQRCIELPRNLELDATGDQVGSRGVGCSQPVIDSSETLRSTSGACA